MRIAILVGLLIGTAACGAYHFPGSGSDTGTVQGQVLALGAVLRAADLQREVFWQVATLWGARTR